MLLVKQEFVCVKANFPDKSAKIKKLFTKHIVRELEIKKQANVHV